MYRNVINDFALWYEEGHNKILYVKGAYGVGKTWAVKDFATAFFADLKYIDCSKNHAFKDIICRTIDDDNDEDDVSIETKISDVDFILEQHFGNQSNEDCLLVFDEIQTIEHGSEFFLAYKNAHPEITMCLIASSMQITEYEYVNGDVFHIVRMRPMTFEEYMIANKANPLLAAIENHKNMKLGSLEEKNILLMLKDYMLTGGMPKVVHDFLKNRDYSVIRPLQIKIIEEYESRIRNSFSFAMSQRCRRIWTSIPKQLSHDNKKFMYKYVEDNARAREYADATQLLCDMGFARKLPRITSCEMPLEDNVDKKSFELFLIDHGLLRAILNLPVDESIELKDIFTDSNGSIAEQFLFQELSNKVGFLYYWISGATARVPFVYEGEDAPVPVEIQFVPNKKAQAIKVFREKNPQTEFSLKISLEQVYLDNKSLNIPAYGLWNM